MMKLAVQTAAWPDEGTPDQTETWGDCKAAYRVFHADDCFTAWLGVSIAEGLSLHPAAKRAVQAASLAVTRAGAQAGMPFRKEVGNR